MKRAYRIHPELFHRLYNTWSTLDRFQRTRGVLRLVVIYSRWSRDDTGLLTMPASVPIIEQNVDGEKSLPRRLERENPSLARYSAVRRRAGGQRRGTRHTRRIPPGRFAVNRKAQRAVFVPGMLLALLSVLFSGSPGTGGTTG